VVQALLSDQDGNEKGDNYDGEHGRCGWVGYPSGEFEGFIPN
jgi:hypothetical protein